MYDIHITDVKTFRVQSSNLMCPVTGASALPRFFSRLTLASASSPNMDLAYRLAAMKPHSPDRACKKMEEESQKRQKVLSF